MDETRFIGHEVDAELDGAVTDLELEGMLGDNFPDDRASCPRCGMKPMVKRRSKIGEFLGCPRYPECRGTRPIHGGEPKARCGNALNRRST